MDGFQWSVNAPESKAMYVCIYVCVYCSVLNLYCSSDFWKSPWLRKDEKSVFNGETCIWLIVWLVWLYNKCVYSDFAIEDQTVDHTKNRLFIKMTQKTLKHNNFNEVRAYLRNVLITELMTNKNGTWHIAMRETSSSPLQQSITDAVKQGLKVLWDVTMCTG